MRSLFYEETHSSPRKGRPMKDFEEFYNAHYPGLYAYCVTLTRNRADAEDLAAEAMYRAIRHAGRPAFALFVDPGDLAVLRLPDGAQKKHAAVGLL